MCTSQEDSVAWECGIGAHGRHNHGPTPPGAATPCVRTTPLNARELSQVVEIIARGRRQMQAEHLPLDLRSRAWGSVEAVLLALEDRISPYGGGWKVGAASEEVRRTEGLPHPAPGRIDRRKIFQSGVELGPEHFINFRNCESEFAFELGVDFSPRDKPYSEADARAGIVSLVPAIEMGDTVFLDWYDASGYWGSCYDNGGGAGLVVGEKIADWQDIDLPGARVDLYMNDQFIKSGQGGAAMGHPITSLTWMLNWLRQHGKGVSAGEIISTGTCTGHLFAAPGDVVKAVFGPLGIVEIVFK